MNKLIKQKSYIKTALTITLYYAIAAILWIITSDLVLSKLFNFENYVHLQTIKGLVFVLSTSLLVFYLQKRFIKSIAKSEENLRLSEEKFSAAFHKGPHLLSITRLSDGKIIDINDEFERVSGYKRKEVIGKTTMELGAWVSEKERNQYIKSYSEGNLNSKETALRFKSGEINLFEGSFQVITINGEKCAITVLQDITDKKQSENKILKLSRFYSFISEINQAIIRINSVDKLFKEICRITVEFGKLNMVWIGIIDQNSKDVVPVATGGFVDGYLEEVRTSIKDEVEGNGMTGTAIKSRRYCVVNDIAKDSKFDNCRVEAFKRNYRSAIAFPIFINDSAVGAFMLYSSEPNYFNEEEIHLLEEVTANISYALNNIEIENALKQSEARLKSFLNSNDIFMSIIEMLCDDIVFVWPNQHVLDFFGLTIDKMKGKKASELGFSKEAVEAIVSALHECNINKHNISFKYSLVKDGIQRWYLGDVNLIEENVDTSPKFSLAAIDITDLKETELKLIGAKEKAMEADRLKSEFLAQISHEIRSPINVILNYVSLLKDEVNSYLSEDIQYSFTAIDNSARRLIRTIDLILNMAQVQTGKIELKPKVIDLYQELLVPVTSEFTSSASAKGLNLKLISTTESTKVKVDEYTTSHIFVNLIDNAIKYTPSGYIEVSVYKKNNCLAVDVKDSGIGISEEFIDSLFTPFRQEEGGYSRRFEGNGLGLALVKNYCDLNNAIINVESKKGKGTKFSVIFKNINS